jgi:hypothetical protein
VANQTVQLQYWYQRNLTGAGASALFCDGDSVTALTTPDGSFSIAPSLPNGSCSTHGCTVISGPYGPITFRLNRSDPAGDLLRVTLVGTSARLVWASALQGVALDPSGLLTVSADAPTNVRAVLSAGDGGPSPASMVFHWVLEGSGWRMLSGAAGPNVTLEGLENASAGSLVLFSNGTYNGSSFSMPAFTDALAAVSTAIATASLAPTAVDAGDTVTVSLSGSGAAGYRYDGAIDPGLGLVSVALSCTTSAPDLQSVVTVRCTGAYSYPSAGIAQPVANLSNGHSASHWPFPPVTVASRLLLSVSPTPAEGYRGTLLPFQLSVTAGTGTSPYGPACLDPGTGALRCGAVGGTSWSLGFAYNASGSYEAVASVVDAAGANHTEHLPVTVADVPALGIVALATNVPASSTVVNLSAELRGGLWPATFWWNDSLPGGTMATGLLASDGPVRLAYLAGTPGFHNVSLTVVDALGTRVATATTIAVGEGPAARLLDDGTMSRSPTPAGTVSNLTLRAASDFGGTVRSFSAGFFLSVGGPGNAYLLNSSAGPLSPGANGTVFVPAAAWSDGKVLLAFSATTVGLWSLSVDRVPGIAHGALTISVPIGPQSRHPRLLDPTERSADPRSGETLWAIADPYGNPILDGYVIVRSVFSVATLDVDSPVLPNAHGGSVWVNYTGLGTGAGTILVLDAFNESLLPPIQISAVPAAAGPWLPILAGIVLAGTIAGVLVVRGVARWRTARPGSDDPAAELERHAVGRDHLLRKLAEGPSGSIGSLALGWSGPGPPPDPPEIAEWLAALIAEGAVTAQTGPGGRPVFLRTDDRRASPELTLDDAALERALARRGGDGGPDAADRP